MLVNAQPIIAVRTTCPHCQKLGLIQMSLDSYERWKSGELIQVAMPELSRVQREQLISGYCEDCFEQLFGDDDE